MASVNDQFKLLEPLWGLCFDSFVDTQRLLKEEGRAMLVKGLTVVVRTAVISKLLSI